MSFLIQQVRPRDLWLALALSALVTAVDVRALGLPVGAYFSDHGAPPDTLMLLRRTAGVAALLVAQAALFWAAFASPWPVRIAALAAFAAVTFLEYGFVAGAGAVMNAQDVPMALQSLKFWPAMIRAFVDWRAAVPVAAFVAALAVRRVRPASWLPAWAVAAVLMGLVQAAYGAAYVKRTQLGDDADIASPPMSACESFARTLTITAAQAIAEAREPYRRQDITVRAATLPRRHLVLVIDESISASHLSLDGYTRPTTPWLDALERSGRLTRWHEAAAATVYSNSSFLALVTGFNAFPDLQRRVLTLPTIFQFAKAMGYRTHLFDGQLSGRRFGLTQADMRFVDDWQPARAFGDDPDTDVRMARAVARLLEAGDGQFVLVVKRGNHEPHELNYPRGAGTWQPSEDGPVPPAQDAVARTNTYDNAIRYNLDAFFRALLHADGSLPRTAGFYTSDHGEALGVDGEPPLIRKLVPEVATVPLFLFGDSRPPVDLQYGAGHHNLFPTFLDLMGVPASARPWTYSRSLLTARAADRDPRPVLAGFMFGGSDFHEVKEFAALRGKARVTSERP